MRAGRVGIARRCRAPDAPGRLPVPRLGVRRTLGGGSGSHGSAVGEQLAGAPGRVRGVHRPQPPDDARPWYRACLDASGRPASRHGFPTSRRTTTSRGRPSPHRVGLRSAFAMPMLRGDDVLGVMEFFSCDTRQPDADLVRTLGTVGSQIGVYVDRKRSTEELDRFFTVSLDILGIANFDGYFLRVNPAWERVLGINPQELLAHPFVDFVHPDDRAATLAALSSLSQGTPVVNFENRYRSRRRVVQVAGMGGGARARAGDRVRRRPRCDGPHAGGAGAQGLRRAAGAGPPRAGAEHRAARAARARARHGSPPGGRGDPRERASSSRT